MDPASMIRILYVIGTLDVGGAERQLAALVKRLDRTRFEPHVCALTSGGPVQAEIEAAGVPVKVIGLRGFYKNFAPLSLVRIPAALVRLYRYIRRGRFDIIHGVLYHAYVLAALLGRAARIPRIVGSRRGLDNEIYQKRIYRLAGRLADRRTDLIIANSNAIKREVVRRDGLDPGRVFVVPNGIDASAYTPGADPAVRAAARRGLGQGLGWADNGPESGPVVGMIANLNRYKDHPTFLTAAAEVALLFPAVRFLLVGEGSMRPSIEARMVELGLEEYIVLAGARSDIPAVLSAIDIFVLASHEEGLPNSILEAMAAGKPVVATNVGGVAEAVEDGVTGLLVPHADPAALASAIRRLLADPGEAAAMGRAGRERVVCTFTMEAMVRATEAAYDVRNLRKI
jgi:glycosyltransferase involved in cell wall biosynthesis